MILMMINKGFCLFCVIVDFGKGSKVLRKSKELGTSGGTFLLAKGTANSNLLKILGLDEIRKEILMMVIEEELEEVFHEELAKEFHFHKPNKGIAFSIPLNRVIGLKGLKIKSNPNKKGGNVMSIEAIITIVDRGLADEVIEAARRAGATGGTIIHGRGAGIHEKEKLFNMEIEPEKDIILIISETKDTETILEAINESLDIEKSGAGIIFVIDINRATGLFRKNR